MTLIWVSPVQKLLARNTVYWKNIDRDIETIIKNCDACNKFQNQALKVPTHHWEVVTEPWSQLYMDFAGPINNVFLLITIDSYSKWAKIHVFSAAPTVASIIEKFKNLFAQERLYDIIVSIINVRSLKQAFLLSQAIKHIFLPQIT